MPKTKETVAKLTRRSFLKGTGAAAGAIAAGAGSASLFDASAWIGEAVADEGSDERVAYTYHPANCGNRCSIKCTVRNGRVAMIEPNDWQGAESDHSVCCLKGMSELQRAYGPDRIQTPLKRVGARGSDEFVSITWDEALDTVADAIRKATGEHGGEGVFFQFSTSAISYRMEFIAKFLGAPTAIVDGTDMGQGNGSDYTTGHMLVGLHQQEITDWVNTSTLLLVGNNFLETQMTDADIFFRAKEAGARIVVIDPIYTPTAQHADEWHSIRPGTDPALYLAMAHEIVKNGSYDEDFIRAHSNFPFLVSDEDGSILRAKPAAKEDTAETNPFLVWDETTDSVQPAEAPGVQAALEGAHEIDGTRYTTVFSLFKERIKDYTAAWAAAECDIPEDVIADLARAYACDGPAYLATGFGGIDKFSNADIAGHAASILPVLTGNFARKGGGFGCVNTHYACSGSVAKMGAWKIPDEFKPGKLPCQVVDLKTRPNSVRVLMNVGNGMYQNMGNFNTTVAWLDTLDLVVTIDPYFNDSARHSDIVLPACTFLETDEQYRTIENTKNHMLLQSKVIDPLFESRTDMRIERELCERLGFAQYLPKDMGELNGAQLKSDDPMLEGITLDALAKNNGIMRLNVSDEPYRAWPDKVYETGSGRLEPYHEATIGSGQALPSYVAPIEAYPGNPLAERYPLQLGQKHGRYRAHSSLSNSTWINQLEEPGCVYVSTDDAAERDLATGDAVRIFNDRGSMEAVCKVSAAVRPGSALVNDGGWMRYGNGSGLPSLINETLCERAAFLPYGGNIPYNDTLVQIEKA